VEVRNRPIDEGAGLQREHSLKASPRHRVELKRVLALEARFGATTARKPKHS